MTMLVMKFGGTSVGSGSAILHVAAIILDHQHRQPLVVTSAMSGVTDALLRLSESLAAGHATGALLQLQGLRERHLSAARVIDPDSTWKRLHRVLGDLEAAVTAPSPERPGSFAARDRIAAFGELLAVTLVTGALEKCGGAAVACLKPIILTNDQFGEAAPEVEATAEAVGRFLRSVGAAIPVTAGFIGCTSDGRVTTLGRGGSDYSATLLANAVSAEACWIYTDVDGVYSADPRIVPDAQVLSRISAATASRLSYCGARVLHPRSVAPAARSGIELRVRNTFRPQHAGTLIQGGQTDVPAVAEHPLAVVGRRHLTSIGLVGRVWRRYLTPSAGSAGSSPTPEPRSFRRLTPFPATIRKLSSTRRTSARSCRVWRRNLPGSGISDSSRPFPRVMDWRSCASSEMSYTCRRWPPASDHWQKPRSGGCSRRLPQMPPASS